MNTIERVKALSLATGINEDDLIGVIQKELGHTHALDEFIPYGNIHAKALANSPILHIVAGNTPEAAIQSLTRGLLVGAHNFVKLPKNGLDGFDSFMMKLPSELVNLIETSSDREIVDEWISFSKVVIVFGSDETVFDVSRKMTSTQTLISHNHKISIAVVNSDPTKKAAGLAAIDIHKFDQMGCLSPHCIYVDPKEKPRSFAARLARSLDSLNQKTVPTNRNVEVDARIDHLRRSYEFRASNDTSVQIWKSQNNTNWTVVYEDEPQFAQSPLGQFVFVKPIPDDLKESLNFIIPSISTIAIHPYNLESAKSMASIGGTRFCPLGSSQTPSFYWHHDGYQSLAPLVTWLNAG